MRDRKTERRAATRAEILAAATELMREQGVAGLSLRDLGARVGMKAQSLYSYFDSKEAIYDAVFQQGATEMLERGNALARTDDARAYARSIAQMFFDFCLEDAARYQLLFQRTIPGFEPSPEAYAPSVEGLEHLRVALVAAGADRDGDLDLCTGVLNGLIDQQIANDPGGDRWYRLLDEALDMYFAHIDARKTGAKR